jgi:type VI secretion system protein ImpF
MTPSRIETANVRVKLSLLDRLCDDEPDAKTDPHRSRHQSLRMLKASLLRDLSALLNTKRCEMQTSEEFLELNNSILAFGLPDFTSFSLRNPVEQSRLRREVESCIRKFEPRLTSVTVHLEPRGEFDSAVHFRVDAQLRIEPEPEPVTFDTVLEADTCHFVIAGEPR